MGCSNSLIVPEDNLATKRETVKRVEDEIVTAEQKLIIRKTWKILSRDRHGTGINILSRIVRLDPHIKQIMRFDGLEGDALLRDSSFNLQASRLVEVLEATVRNVDQLQNLMGPFLYELGKRHYSFQGFLPKYWSLVSRAVLYVWKQELHDKYTSEVPKAWSALLRFMVAQMKKGYHEACVEYTMHQFDQITNDEK